MFELTLIFFFILRYLPRFIHIGVSRALLSVRLRSVVLLTNKRTRILVGVGERRRLSLLSFIRQNYRPTVELGGVAYDFGGIVESS